jgi:hypothetical protein
MKREQLFNLSTWLVVLIVLAMTFIMLRLI